MSESRDMRDVPAHGSIGAFRLAGQRPSKLRAPPIWVRVSVEIINEIDIGGGDLPFEAKESMPVECFAISE